MKLNDTMVFNILSALCPKWDSSRLDSSLKELSERGIYYNREKTSCFVTLPDQLVTIKCDFKNGILFFSITNWNARSVSSYSLEDVFPELAKKSKIKPKASPKKHSSDTNKDKETKQILNQMNKYHKIRKRKSKKHNNYIDELFTKYGRD